jgi:HEAT repeat protein
VPVTPFNAHLDDVRRLALAGDVRGLVRAARFARRARVRAAAAEALGTFGEQAVGPLLQALADMQGGVFLYEMEGGILDNEVTHALHLVGEPAVPGLIATMLGAADADVRHAAAYVLTYSSDPRAGPAAVRALADPDIAVREMALFVIGYNAYAPALARVVAIARGDDSFAIAAVHPDQLSFDDLLGHDIGLPDGEAGVVVPVVHERLDLGAEAAGFANLPEFHNELPVDDLVERCTEVSGQDLWDHFDPHDPDPDLVEKLPPPSREAMLRSLRVTAVSVLEEFEDYRAIETLVQIAICDDEDIDLRSAAVSGLGRIGSPDGRWVVERALRDPRLHDAALECIGGFRDPRDVPLLVRHLRDSDPHVRRLAVGSLGRMRSAESLRYLLRALTDEKVRTVREDVVTWLVNSDDPRVIEPLYYAAADPDDEFREYVLDELKRLAERVADKPAGEPIS